VTAVRKTVLSNRRVGDLRHSLNALLGHSSDYLRLDNDPLQFSHRYTDPADQEIAAIFSACLAYGRVSAFLPVINHVLTIAGSAGPREWIEGFNDKDIQALQPIIYRVITGEEEARLSASAALAAVEGPLPGPAPTPGDEKHVMMSCALPVVLMFRASTDGLCADQTNGTCK